MQYRTRMRSTSLIAVCQVIYVLALWLAVSVQQSAAIRCDRTPDGFSANKLPADGSFLLKIGGNPDRYVPGEPYNVTIVGTRSQQKLNKFIGFAIGAERVNSFARNSFVSSRDKNDDVGEFQLMPGDPQAIFSSRCPGLIQHSSLMSKSEVQVTWIAPQAGAGCIAIRATVIEHRDVWYKDDDGRLSKVMCEDEGDSLGSMPAVMKHCCACDEAKYELTFEGLWSRHTHPKDFPSNGWLTRFSDVIGASHTVDYYFWAQGKQATEGLQQLAEHGATRKLEHELKEEAEDVRTIIKARGFAYPNLNSRTYAAFRVDSKHHLISLVTQVDPSPDWFVGVSGLELCLPNCSWIESKVLDLYPWDAGTDGGATYISPPQPVEPHDGIRRIKHDSPNDPRSPFYDPTGTPMKPMARLYVNRQRIYASADENCKEEPEEGGRDGYESDNDNGHDDDDDNGYERDDPRPPAHPQRRPQPSYGGGGGGGSSTYYGREQNDQQEESEQQEDINCDLTPWSEWSPCSSSCGVGLQTRTREFEVRKNAQQCRKLNPRIKLQEKEKCKNEEGCGGEIGDDGAGTPAPPSPGRGRGSGGGRGGGRKPRCKLSEWSDWSPCSTTCGVGYEYRDRIPLHLLENSDEVRGNGFETRSRPRRNRYNDEDDEDEDDEDEENGDDDNNNPPEEEFPDKVTDKDDICFGKVILEKRRCGNNQPSCEEDQSDLPYYCYIEPRLKNCDGKSISMRWYYNATSDSCAVFPFCECRTGACPQQNHFLDHSECMERCSRPQSQNSLIRDQNGNEVFYGQRRQLHRPQERRQPKTNQFQQQHRYQEQQPQYRQPEQPQYPTHNGDYDDIMIPSGNLVVRIDCKTSPWQYTPCNVTCGEGVRVKTRKIITQPRNGGKPCPSKLRKVEPCVGRCDMSYDITPSRSTSNRISNNLIDFECRYSAWSAWSPCSKTCGEGAIQLRTRYVLDPSKASHCTNRLEERRCENILPCLAG